MITTVRIPDELVNRVDALGTPKVNRSDVLRRAIEAGLKILESEREREGEKETAQANAA